MRTGESVTQQRPAARRAGGSKTPRRRSPAWVSRDNGHRSRNAMIPDMAGMGQMCPAALVAVQSDE